ncbi:putative AC transposase [Glycine soja]
MATKSNPSPSPSPIDQTHSLIQVDLTPSPSPINVDPTPSPHEDEVNNVEAQGGICRLKIQVFMRWMKGQTFLTPKVVQGKQELGARTYDAECARGKLAKAIIMHGYPLSIADHLGFRRYSTVLQLVFQIYYKEKRARSSYVKSELDHYLEEEVLSRAIDFDILMWWKFNGVKYPTLQAIAKDILVIPTFTVALESTFSIGGQILSPHRSRLQWTTLEALMCARSSMSYKVVPECATVMNEMISDDEGEMMGVGVTNLEE